MNEQVTEPLNKPSNKARFADGAILLVIVALVSWAVLARDSGNMRHLVGQSAPPFKLKTQSGEVVGTPTHPGKVILLDFWATWCDPCFRQMPALNKLKKKRDDVVVLAVNVDEPNVNRTQAMKSFIDEAKIEVDSLIDDGSVSAMYGVETIPALVLIDRNGVIRYASSGVHTLRELEQQVDAAMEGGQ